MKAITIILTALCALLLSSCFTLEGTIEIPNDGRPGGLGGRITGAYSWPQPSGKQPVRVAGKEPLPAAPGYIDINYLRALFGLKAGEPLPPLPADATLPP